MADKPTVLIIEDHKDLREMLAMGLSLAEYDVETAEDGPVGLAAFYRLHPAVVLVDVKLPSAATMNLNGFHVSAKIKQQDPDCIVIVITGDDDPVLHVRMLDSHADRILIKPVLPDQIISEIEYIKAKKEAIKPQAMRAPGQAGGSWFSNREMAQYAINLLFIIALSWFVGHIDAKVNDATHASGLNSVYIQQLREQFAEFKGAHTKEVENVK